MADKKPTDLTRKTWNKLKGLTVPKTGFGDKLDAYQIAKKKTEELATRSISSFKVAADTLQAIIKHIPEAQKKCNKTLHKETIEALAAYKPLAEKEGGELHKNFATYQGYVDKFKHVREVCGQELAQLEKQMKATAESAIAAVKKLVSEGKREDALKHAKDSVADLRKIQERADDSLAKPRVPPPAVESPHKDDRPDASVFTALIEKQNEIIGIRKHAEGELAALVK
jgi:hypothetical protein